MHGRKRLAFFFQWALEAGSSPDSFHHPTLFSLSRGNPYSAQHETRQKGLGRPALLSSSKLISPSISKFRSAILATRLRSEITQRLATVNLVTQLRQSKRRRLFFVFSFENCCHLASMGQVRMNTRPKEQHNILYYKTRKQKSPVVFSRPERRV